LLQNDKKQAFLGSILQVIAKKQPSFTRNAHLPQVFYQNFFCSDFQKF